jgi:Meckel syndrome type 1 protein
MTTSSHPASDREALSALFDGELVGDAARFALKRLDHDQAWRATCERWQYVGDVLRSRNAPLPATFPSRVRATVQADATQRGHNGRARQGGFRWGSVALAASAAVVAFFLARSPVGGPDQAPAAPSQVAVAAPSQGPSQPPATQKPDAPAVDLESATAAVAVAAIARPAQRNRNVQRDRAATDRIVSSMVASHSPVTAEVVSMPVSDDIALDERGAQSDASPFTGSNAADVRPWPRAVLPQYRNTDGLAADYATAPTFYPFVPATQDSQPASDVRNTDAATNPQAPPSP